MLTQQKHREKRGDGRGERGGLGGGHLRRGVACEVRGQETQRGRKGYFLLQLVRALVCYLPPRAAAAPRASARIEPAPGLRRPVSERSAGSHQRQGGEHAS